MGSRGFGSGAVNSSVTPEFYGAVGDGVTNDRTALLAAMQSGKMVDGNGRTYAVSGNMTPTSLNGLRNIKIKQLAPATTYTLTISGLSKLSLSNVEFLANAQYGSLVVTTSSVLYVYNSGQVSLDRVTVRDGGPITAITVQTCTDVIMSDCRVRDFAYTFGAQPSDDAFQGIYLVGVSNFVLSNCSVRDHSPNWPSRPTPYRRWGRGFVLAQCTDGALVNCRASLVDQGYDLTGSGNNRNISITGCQASDCTTVGFKCANGYSQITQTGLQAVRCGFLGFQYGGPGEIGQAPQDVSVTNCIATDTGSNGLWQAGGAGQFLGSPTGFRLMASGIIDMSYPRNVRFRDCLAVDRQTVPTMLFGYQTDVTNPLADSTVDLSICENCESVGHTSSAFSSLASHLSRVEGTTTQSIADATYTNLTMATVRIDNARIHDNSNTMTVRADGVYMMHGQICYAANGTGNRGARFRVNGATVGETMIVAVTGEVTILHVYALVRINRGNTITLQAYQTSGGALNVDRTRSAFEINRVESWG